MLGVRGLVRGLEVGEGARARLCSLAVTLGGLCTFDPGTPEAQRIGLGTQVGGAQEAPVPTPPACSGVVWGLPQRRRQ